MQPPAFPFSFPLAAGDGGWGWAIILLAAPGLVVLIGVVVAFLFRRKSAGDGPGYYHILGLDEATGARREMTVRADSRENARGRAELSGMVVGDVRQVDGSE